MTREKIEAFIEGGSELKQMTAEEKAELAERVANLVVSLLNGLGIEVTTDEDEVKKPTNGDFIKEYVPRSVRIMPVPVAQNLFHVPDTDGGVVIMAIKKSWWDDEAAEE